jgi:glycosyltransferase involved in cell wall biosynthesis
MKTAPKVAIVHDWLTNMGGAERVVLAMHEAFPDAPIYTSVYEPDKLPLFKGLDVRTTRLQRWPKAFRRLHRLFPAMRVKAFRQLDLSEYDIILTSSSAESKQVRKARDGQVHICYCHTPIRYYWSHYNQYKKDPGMGKLNWLMKLAMPVLVPRLKKADYRAAQNVDVFVANSTEVQKRIQKYYKKPAVVIHPPVDSERFVKVSAPRDKRYGYIALGRQVPYKRIDLAVAACTALNLPLTVIGDGPEHDRLVSMAGPSVIFDTDKDKDDIKVARMLGKSRGFIFPAEEDFGIVQIEALAAGTPVIAYASGGSEDIVHDGEGGVTFPTQDTASVEDALLRAEQIQFDPAKLQRIAKRFHKSLFVTKIRKIVSDSAV